MDLKKPLKFGIHAKFFLVGLLSFLWLLFRTGMKPTRITYPCQQSAAATASLWGATYFLPLVALFKPHPSHRSDRGRLLRVGIVVSIIVIGAVFLMTGVLGSLNGIWLGQGAVSLPLEESLSEAHDASELFVVNNTTGDDGGVAALIDLMTQHGLPFYQTTGSGAQKDSAGLIGRNDVVIIKVNSQWSERGGTNTDLVKAVIRAITKHPQGFSGEIIIADNGQGVGDLNRNDGNAEDVSQSFEDVAASFAMTYRVSTYLWDTITTSQVGEYDAGDLRDGYIINTTPDPQTGIYVSYPKFTTNYGTKVSLKNGIWDQNTQTYDTTRLKLINIPVLKSHGTYGVSGAVKHYMGVVSTHLTNEAGMNSHATVGTGGMGTEMVGTRFPTLSILDAIWVNAHPLDGPWTSYEDATRVNVVAASTDPVALDAWAARSILIPTAHELGYTNISSMDPDYREAGSLGRWLELSMEEIQQGGYFSTMDIGSMNVYVVEQGSTVTPSPTITVNPVPEEEKGTPLLFFAGVAMVLVIAGGAAFYLFRER